MQEPIDRSGPGASNSRRQPIKGLTLDGQRGFKFRQAVAQPREITVREMPGAAGDQLLAAFEYGAPDGRFVDRARNIVERAHQAETDCSVGYGVMTNLLTGEVKQAD